MLIFLRGPNTNEIISDALDMMDVSDKELVLVVASDEEGKIGDVNYDILKKAVDEAHARGETVDLVANGGTTQNLLSVMKILLRTGVRFDAFDVQKNGISCFEFNSKGSYV